jgi:hypothetical protein
MRRYYLKKYLKKLILASFLVFSLVSIFRSLVR